MAAVDRRAGGALVGDCRDFTALIAGRWWSSLSSSAASMAAVDRRALI
jgi:hypothetical protein